MAAEALRRLLEAFAMGAGRKLGRGSTAWPTTWRLISTAGPAGRVSHLSPTGPGRCGGKERSEADWSAAYAAAGPPGARTADAGPTAVVVLKFVEGFDAEVGALLDNLRRDKSCNIAHWRH